MLDRPLSGMVSCAGIRADVGAGSGRHGGRQNRRRRGVAISPFPPPGTLQCRFFDKQKVFDLAQPVLANVSSVQCFQPTARDGFVEVTEAQFIPQGAMRASFIFDAPPLHSGTVWHGLLKHD